MSSASWTPRPGDPCPPDRFTHLGPHAFVEEDELALRRARWHAMNAPPQPPSQEEENASEAATSKASGESNERTSSSDVGTTLAGRVHAPSSMGLAPLDWAFQQDAGGPGPKLVLVVLARHCGKDRDRCWPAVSTIGELASMGRTAVRDNLERLQALGLIQDTGDRRGATRQVVVWQLGNVPDSERLKVPESEQVEGAKVSESGRQGVGFRSSPNRIPATEPPMNLQGRVIGGGRAADASGGLAPAAAAAPLEYPSIGNRDLWVKLYTSRKRTATQADFDAWGEQALGAQADGCDVDAGIQQLIDKRGFRDFPRVGAHHPRQPGSTGYQRKVAVTFPADTRAPGRTYD